MKTTLYIVTAVLLIAIALFTWKTLTAPTATIQVGADYKSVSYLLEGQPEKINGSSVRYFGNEVTGDLNGDGKDDIAFILTHDGGGSGTFYYVVVALKADNGYAGTNGILLGDRIAPQTTEIHDGEIVVNYADRKAGESMVTPPSVGVSKYLRINGRELTEISVEQATQQ